MLKLNIFKKIIILHVILLLSYKIIKADPENYFYLCYHGKVDPIYNQPFIIKKMKNKSSFGQLRLKKTNNGNFIVDQYSSEHTDFYDHKHNKEDVKNIELNLNKGNIKLIFNKNKEYTLNISNYCSVIFEIIFKNGNTVYYLIINPNSVRENKKTDGVFTTNEENPNIEEIHMIAIYGNINSWKNIEKMFSGQKSLKKISFLYKKYNFENISKLFKNCENLEKIDNYKNLFSESTSDCSSMFYGVKKINSIDLSGIMVPQNDFGTFAYSWIKTVNLDGTNFKKCKEDTGMFQSSNIESIDLSKTINFPKDISCLFLKCNNLKKVKFPENLEVSDSGCTFYLTKNLKTIDVSSLNFKNAKTSCIDAYFRDKTFILNNNEEMAKYFLKNLQNGMMNEDVKTGKIIYNGNELENFYKYDDIDEFLKDPKEYKKKRDSIIEENKKIKGIGNPCCSCCEKCCNSCKR